MVNSNPLVIFIHNLIFVFRWMRKFGFQSPPEYKMRITMETWCADDNFESELTPFNGVFEKKVIMISAAMAYVKNLVDFVISYLDLLEK